MKKIYIVVVCVLATYFALTVFVFPKIYQDVVPFHPKPELDVKLSTQKIILGESFQVDIYAYNKGDAADLQIVTVAFPKNEDLDNIKIVSYDFLQSPQMIQKGKEIGSDYTAGKTTTLSKYPFIEAYSRPSKTGDSYKMTLEITPKETGVFRIYTKTVAMPHTDETSHFPADGLRDHQNEFVQEHSVIVSRETK